MMSIFTIARQVGGKIAGACARRNNLDTRSGATLSTFFGRFSAAGAADLDGLPTGARV
jgi:hypothetical protein